MQTKVPLKPARRRRRTISRFALAAPAAIIVTVLVLMAMIELLQVDRTAPAQTVRFYPDLGRLADTSDVTATPRLPAADARPGQTIAPDADDVATVVWDTLPALPGTGRLLGSSLPEGLANDAPKPTVTAPWTERRVDWRSQANAVAAEMIESEQRNAPRYFSERTGARDRGGPQIDFDVNNIAPDTRLPESYRNAYGEGEVRISEDCVARENRSMADLDYIDVMPAIINCRRPASTFELPPEITGRRPRAPGDQTTRVD